MRWKAKIRYPKLPKSGIKGFSEEETLRIQVIEQKRKLGLTISKEDNQAILDYINKEEKLETYNKPRADLNDLLIEKFAKITITETPDNTGLILSRPDGFAEHKTQIENLNNPNITFQPDNTILVTGHELLSAVGRIKGICAELVTSSCRNPTTNEMDDCILISGTASMNEVEQAISDLGLEIKPMTPEDESRGLFVKPIDPNDESKGQEEDVDEILEPMTEGETKKLKSRSVTNQFKENRIIV